MGRLVWRPEGPFVREGSSRVFSDTLAGERTLEGTRAEVTNLIGEPRPPAHIHSDAPTQVDARLLSKRDA